MSMELVQKALADIHESETRVVSSRARSAYDELYGPLTDEHAIEQKTRRFIEACRKNLLDSRRGRISRLLHGTVERRTQGYSDYLETDYITPLDRWSARLHDERQPVHKESGRRTLPFDSHTIPVEGEVLDIAWQVGFVESRQVENPIVSHTTVNHGPGSATIYFNFKDGHQFEPAENNTRPVRIWRVISGLAVGGMNVVKREVTHDIHGSTLTTYAEDLQDDDATNFSANMFALGMLQGAIEFVEQ